MKENISARRRLRGKAQNLINAAGVQFRDFFIGEAYIVRSEVVYGTGRPKSEEIVLFKAPKVQKIIRFVFPQKKLRT